MRISSSTVAALVTVMPLTNTAPAQWLDSGGVAAKSASYSSRSSVGRFVGGAAASASYTVRHGLARISGVGTEENLLNNGSFEDTANTFVSDGRGVMSIPDGATTIPGWTVVGAELLWGDNTNAFGPTTPFGTKSVELTGYHDAEPFAELTQTIVTEPGQHYRITFALGTYAGAGWSGAVGVEVSAGDTTRAFTGSDWRAVRMDFTATDAATEIRLRGTLAQVNFTGVPVYLGLDNVIVSISNDPPTTSGLIVFDDKNVFLADTNAASATGPLPQLGTVHDLAAGQDPAESPFIGSLRFTAAPGGDNVWIGIDAPGIDDWYGPLPGNDIALGVERLEVLSNRPIHAFGFDFAEPNLTMPEGGGVPVDSEFEVVVMRGGRELDRFRFNAPDDEVWFVGFRLDEAFDRVRILEITEGGTADDEFFGEFFTDAPPFVLDGEPVGVSPDEGSVQVSLGWPGDTGTCVILQGSDDMSIWENIAKLIVNADGSAQHTETLNELISRRFYRLIECPKEE
ncbi:MAG: DUF642 domain-containing protein [Verrucomicrobiales bacterium]